MRLIIHFTVYNYVKYNAVSTIVVKLTNQIMQHAKGYKTPEVLVINYNETGTTGPQVPLYLNLRLKFEGGQGGPGPTGCWTQLT